VADAMRTLVVLGAIAACSTSAPRTEAVGTPVPQPAGVAVDRWGQVEERARPLVPAAPVDALARALSGVDNDMVADDAIDGLLAWADARGGVPWRDDHRTGGEIATAKLHASKLAKAVLEHRHDDTRAVHAVAYLAQRLRDEGGCALDALIGFGLAVDVHDASPHAFDNAPELAPTDAEVRRALAIESVCAEWLIENDREELENNADSARRGMVGDKRLRRAAGEGRSYDELRVEAKRALVELALDAPGDRTQIPAYVEALLARYEHSWLVLTLVDGVQRRAASMNDAMAAVAR
jgi:SHS2 domain-containing protein